MAGRDSTTTAGSVPAGSLPAGSVPGCSSNAAIHSVTVTAGTLRPPHTSTEVPDAAERTWPARALLVVVILVVALSADAAGGGPSFADLHSSWQLIDLDVLADDPLGSVWYLHTQPPVHNMVVGVVGWLPLPIAGSLFVLYVAALAVGGLLLHDLLVRWGTGPRVAAAVAAFALASPGLVGTVAVAGYEVPASTLTIGALWSAQRYLGTGHAKWLLVTSAVLTTAALTRGLLHPAWVVGALGLLLAVRPVSRRNAAAVLAVPVVLLGGWMLKNELLFGSPSMSSWTGFNLQRGVTAVMDEEDVRAAVRRGDVSELALEHPWGSFDHYRERGWSQSCRPRHGHPAVSRADKPVPGTGSVANFNHECLLPVYDQAQRDAVTLMRRDPGRYLSTRTAALATSFDVGSGCHTEVCTWMDAVYRPLLAGVDVHIGMEDWNLPLLGDEEGMTVKVSLTLAAACCWVMVRGGMAAVRLRRLGWRGRHAARTGEVVWLLAAWTVTVVVVGGDLVEFGENGRFRAMVDPLLLALPLASVARARAARSARARANGARGTGRVLYRYRVRHAASSWPAGAGVQGR